MSVETRDAERSRTQILDAAEYLFAVQGYDKTSLVEIGSHANLSRATPTYFYKNKEALYQAVLLRLVEDEKNYVSRFNLLEGNNIIQRINDLLSAHIDFIFHRPAYVYLICREALDNNGFLLDTQSFLSIIEQGKELIELARGDGLISNQDTDSILMYSLAVTWFPFLQSNLITKSLGNDPFSTDFLNRHKDFVTKTFTQNLLM